MIREMTVLTTPYCKQDEMFVISTIKEPDGSRRIAASKITGLDFGLRPTAIYIDEAVDWPES